MTSPQPFGYLVPEFQLQTHAFFWREIAALEEAGVPVLVMSTSRPPPQSCPHDFAERARARTRYLFPPRPGAIIELLKRPAKAVCAAGYVLGLRETPVLQRLKRLALVPTAMGMVGAAREAGFDHVLIHSCANAAHLGALA